MYSEPPSRRRPTNASGMWRVPRPVPACTPVRLYSGCTLFAADCGRCHRSTHPGPTGSTETSATRTVFTTLSTDHNTNLASVIRLGYLPVHVCQSAVTHLSTSSCLTTHTGCQPKHLSATVCLSSLQVQREISMLASARFQSLVQQRRLSWKYLGMLAM